MNYKIFLTIFLLIFTASISTAQEIATANLKKHIYYLSSDKMKGRATGSKEQEKAVKYITKYFKKYRLAPLGDNGYIQHFHAKAGKNTTDSLQAQNIIGFIDNKAAYTIVIGAHYDHLGHGDFGGSRDTLNIGKIHNGADDNASGVAGLLELARYYVSNNKIEPYNLLFIAFGAEELGLIGSKYWTENPTMPLTNIHWMLNMDMIGRYNPNNGLAIIGYGTAKEFPNIFKDLKSPIKFYTSREGNGGSDQTSFYRKNIPVLFFHTGGHEDYHMTTDKADKINYIDLKTILELEIDIINNSMKLSDKMNFVWTN